MGKAFVRNRQIFQFQRLFWRQGQATTSWTAHLRSGTTGFVLGIGKNVSGETYLKEGRITPSNLPQHFLFRALEECEN